MEESYCSCKKRGEYSYNIAVSTDSPMFSASEAHNSRPKDSGWFLELYLPTYVSKAIFSCNLITGASSPSAFLNSLYLLVPLRLTRSSYGYFCAPQLPLFIVDVYAQISRVCKCRVIIETMSLEGTFTFACAMCRRMSFQYYYGFPFWRSLMLRPISEPRC